MFQNLKKIKFCSTRNDRAFSEICGFQSLMEWFYSLAPGTDWTPTSIQWYQSIELKKEIVITKRDWKAKEFGSGVLGQWITRRGCLYSISIKNIDALNNPLLLARTRMRQLHTTLFTGNR